MLGKTTQNNPTQVSGSREVLSEVNYCAGLCVQRDLVCAFTFFVSACAGNGEGCMNVVSAGQAK
jgi:hypothetical protein